MGNALHATLCGTLAPFAMLTEAMMGLRGIAQRRLACCFMHMEARVQCGSFARLSSWLRSARCENVQKPTSDCLTPYGQTRWISPCSHDGTYSARRYAGAGYRALLGLQHAHCRADNKRGASSRLRGASLPVT